MVLFVLELQYLCPLTFFVISLIGHIERKTRKGGTESCAGKCTFWFRHYAYKQ